jgi:hypothetical protein
MYRRALGSSNVLLLLLLLLLRTQTPMSSASRCNTFQSCLFKVRATLLISWFDCHKRQSPRCHQSAGRPRFGYSFFLITQGIHSSGGDCYSHLILGGILTSECASVSIKRGFDEISTPRLTLTKPSATTPVDANDLSLVM